MAKAVIFYNWTNEEFTHTWNKEPYTFPPGQQMMLEEGIADTFAKHLAVREMNKANIHPGASDKLAEFKAKALLNAPIPTMSPERLAQEMLNPEPMKEAVSEVPKKKSGRPKKEVEAFVGV